MTGRLVVIASVLSLVACGGTTFGGLGPDDEDGGFFDDTSTGGDAIFPTDDAASGDSAKFDSSTALDTAVATDSGVVDTAVAETATDDTAVADTAVSDTAAADTAVADTAVADTAVADTAVADTAVADTAVADTAVADTATTADTAPSWPNVVGKTGCYDTESGTKGPVQCSNTCCEWNVFGTWHSNCSDTCILSRSYDCDEKADCGGGNLCCTGTGIGGGVNGSSCKSSCGSDIQLCATSAECTGGKTCSAYTPPDAKWTFGSCK